MHGRGYHSSNECLDVQQESDRDHRVLAVGDILMLISGDLNLDLKSENGRDFVAFMKRLFNIDLVSNVNMVTTRDGTVLDAVFARGLDRVDCRNFVSYFSYH